MFAKDDPGVTSTWPSHVPIFSKGHITSHFDDGGMSTFSLNLAWASLYTKHRLRHSVCMNPSLNILLLQVDFRHLFC